MEFSHDSLEQERTRKTFLKGDLVSLHLQHHNRQQLMLGINLSVVKPTIIADCLRILGKLVLQTKFWTTL